MDDNGLLIPLGILIIFIIWFVGGMFNKVKTIKERWNDTKNLFGLDEDWDD